MEKAKSVSSGYVWKMVGIYRYLINDPNNKLSEIYTDKEVLGSSKIEFESGLTYAVLSGSYSMDSMLNFTTSHSVHNDDNFVNGTINGTYDPATDFYLGVNCQSRLGSSWKHITKDEGLTTLAYTQGPYWTGTTGSSNNSYYFIDGSNIASDGGYTYDSRNIVCVRP